MQCLVENFGDTFDKNEINLKVDKYLKYVQDQYRIKLKKNLRVTNL